jgi:hypothetical protein
MLIYVPSGNPDMHACLHVGKNQSLGSLGNADCSLS